ncbi:hypothetical protein [Cyclobacterium plantarum]|uniref:Uncharacterized protein n=1 Tax=Cyclobacterium plantarum TaxID=2716263 RepID=A0ABX0HB59_9BACT|nr:hypothetical protein [Cyclobacterium plantarum]NHE58993.1 hypothetical protein [Cyclobacterium plantarum]
MKRLLIGCFLISTFIVSSCSSHEAMEPEDETGAEIPAEFWESLGDGKVAAKGTLSGKIGNESSSADLKSVSFTDFQDIPGFATQMVSLVALVLKPDRDEMINSLQQ